MVNVFVNEKTGVVFIPALELVKDRKGWHRGYIQPNELYNDFHVECDPSVKNEYLLQAQSLSNP